MRKQIIIISGKILFIIIILQLLACAGSRKYQMTGQALAVRDSLVFYTEAERIDLLSGTPYQTSAFVFKADTPGTSVLILGGTHGDEPAGYEAALRLLDYLRHKPARRGCVILIPLANARAVESFERRIPVPQGTDKERGNLNRCYPGDPNGLPMEQLAWQIQQLAIEKQVDVFIDLHEARYLHLNTPAESEREKGLGQTLIYYPNEKSAWLLMNLLDYINEMIPERDEKFSGLELPILNSAAWWAGSALDIAAFTFETSRSLELQKRIDYHLRLVQFVLKFYEIH